MSDKKKKTGPIKTNNTWHKHCIKVNQKPNKLFIMTIYI